MLKYRRTGSVATREYDQRHDTFLDISKWRQLVQMVLQKMKAIIEPIRIVQRIQLSGLLIR